MDEIRVRMACVLLSEAGDIIQNQSEKAAPLAEQLRKASKIAEKHIGQIKEADSGETDMDKWREVWSTVVIMLSKLHKSDRWWSAFELQRKTKGQRLNKTDILQKLLALVKDGESHNYSDKLSKDDLAAELVRREVPFA